MASRSTQAEFEQALYVDMLRALDALSAELTDINPRRDIHALSLYIDDQDDPRRRYAELSANTEARARATAPTTAPAGADHVAGHIRPCGRCGAKVASVRRVVRRTWWHR